MNFFKPKPTSTSLLSPVRGELIDVTTLSDPIMAAQTLGPSIAIRPTEGTLVAPFDGTVLFVFPTKHALGLRSDAGLEMLVHIGIDTVSLDGKPFTLTIKDKQRIKAGQIIGYIDLEFIQNAGLDPVTVLIMTSLIGQTLNLPKPAMVNAKHPLIVI
jgi:glucose-specific phosphotransferase system IIA component